MSADLMPARDAWITLGMDPDSVFRRLAVLPRSERARAAEADLVEAKRSAKVLMKAHHPDRGGDPAKFRHVNDAIISLIAHTEEFVKRLKQAEAQAEERASRRGAFIKLG